MTIEIHFLLCWYRGNGWYTLSFAFNAFNCTLYYRHRWATGYTYYYRLLHYVRIRECSTFLYLGEMYRRVLQRHITVATRTTLPLRLFLQIERKKRNAAALLFFFLPFFPFFFFFLWLLFSPNRKCTVPERKERPSPLFIAAPHFSVSATWTFDNNPVGRSLFLSRYTTATAKRIFVTSMVSSSSFSVLFSFRNG